MSKAIVNSARKLIVSTKNSNTTNAWGFGGHVKEIHTLTNGYTLHHGKQYYRHSKPSDIFQLNDQNGLYVESDNKKIQAFINLELEKLNSIEDKK